MPGRILRADHGRIQEGTRVDCVTREPQSIDGWGVNREPRGGFASVIDYNLRIEGCRPAQHTSKRVSMSFSKKESACYSGRDNLARI